MPGLTGTIIVWLIAGLIQIQIDRYRERELTPELIAARERRANIFLYLASAVYLAIVPAAVVCVIWSAVELITR